MACEWLGLISMFSMTGNCARLRSERYFAFRAFPGQISNGSEISSVVGQFPSLDPDGK